MGNESGYDTKVVLDILHSRRNIKDSGERTGDAWPHSYTDSAAYSTEFSGILLKYIKAQRPELDKPQILDKIRMIVREKQKLHGVSVLDVMSFGEVIRDLDVSGMAMGLMDNRTDSMKKYDLEHNIGMITGDILSNKTWDQLDTLYPQGGQFDFIFCRPNGALSAIPENTKVYGFLLSRMYPHLSNADGMLLSQVNGNMWGEQDFSDAFKKLNTVPGITAYSGTETYVGSVMIIKGQQAPSQLPQNL